ncbi:hypothetical protein MPTA5024_26960 [Microbispora sp. ATCC PTA-5024]|nr:hypothetical protein MPTA5024_26960 [Microbispora sp. ATCC PTA-5024]
MSSYTRRQARRLKERHPRVPDRVWSALEMDATHVATAIALMGVLVGAAAADGARTGGRSGFYQTVLVGFGLHGVAHLGQSAAARGYTPGVVTSPGVIAFSLWAWRRLRREDLVPETGTRDLVSDAALFPVAILGVHGAAHGIRLLARRAVRRR